MLSYTLMIFLMIRRILRKQAEEAGDVQAYPKILHKGINVERGEHVMELQAPVMLDLVAYKPSVDEDARLRCDTQLSQTIHETDLLFR